MPRISGHKAVAVTATLVFAFVGAALLSRLAASSGDQSQIEGTIRSRMAWIQGFAATPDGHLASNITLEKAQADSEMTLDTLYTGSLLQTRVEQFKGTLEQQATGDLLIFGGGVDKLAFKSVVIEGSKATAIVEATTWSEIGQRLPDGGVVRSRPTNTEEFTFRLVRIGTSWLIADESLEFAPGSEP